jgi:predicted RNA methylase
MIEADSVHSTPPLSTSASQTSRRSVLAGVASTLAAGTAIAAAATSQRASAVLAAEAADPVYAAIERHGKLSADFSAAVEAYGELEDDPDAFEAAEAIACDTSDALLDHAEKLP